MKIFIENEAGSSKKNIFDEETLVYKKTYIVSRPYPYPYGFLIGTKSGDGDNLDCFIITSQKLRTGQIVDAEAIGMFEQIEDGKDDPKILATIAGENRLITVELEEIFREFITNVFSHNPKKQISIGEFRGKDAADNLILKSIKAFQETMTQFEITKTKNK